MRMRTTTSDLKGRSRRAAIARAACFTSALACGGFAVAEDPMIVVRRDDAKFVPLDPSRPGGAEMAVLWGDPAKGPSSMLLKMKKGEGVLHIHTSNYDLVVLEGQMKHWGEREHEAEAPTLGPGSYWRQPGHQPHADSCLTDTCVTFIKWEGKRDGKLASPPK